MKHLFCLLLILLYGTVTITAQNQKTYYTDAGDKITGTIIEETDSTVTLRTDLGILILDKSSIHAEKIKVQLKNGDIIKGTLLSRSADKIKLETSLGPVEISMDKIATLESGVNPPGARPTKGSWYFNNEQLMDIWFDPTGFPLKNDEFYLSLLSWAFGLSDRFQISSRWSSYFIGDLNIRPKYTLFMKDASGHQSAFSIGGHFHLRGLPNKYEYKQYDVKQTGYWDDSAAQHIEGDTVYQERDWVRIGDTQDEFGNYNQDFSAGNKAWLEVFAAYSHSRLKSTGHGRINFTIGGSAIYYPNQNILPRVYFGADYDVLKNLKLMTEIFWDPYYAPLVNQAQPKDVTFPVFFDVGFITNALPILGGNHFENFWVGIHFQQPFFSLYYKF